MTTPTAHNDLLDRLFGPNRSLLDRRKVIRAAAEAAVCRQIPVHIENEREHIIRFGNGTRFSRTIGINLSSSARLGIDLAKDKTATNWLLDRAGIPTPPGVTTATIEETLTAARRIGYPVVVKPARGAHSAGVVLDIRSEDELRDAFPKVKSVAKSGRVLVERYLNGRQFRFIVVGDRVVAVYEVVRPSVLGDGTHSIGQLVEQLNSDPRRGSDPESLLVNVEFDEATLQALSRNGWTPDTVPPDGEHVVLTLFAHVQTGSSTVNVMSSAHPSNLMIARQAARAVGLSAATMDIISADIGQPLYENGGVVVDINGQSNYNSGYYITSGPSFDVGRDFVSMWFPSGTPVRTPIVAVAKTEHSRELIDRLSRTFAERGMRSGVATCTELRVASVPLVCRSESIEDRLATLLANPWTDLAIVEIDSNGPACLERFPYIDVIATDDDSRPALPDRFEPFPTFVQYHEATRTSGIDPVKEIIVTIRDLLGC